MAIELPRAGRGSVTTGRNPRKAQLPSAETVPTVDVARDPGVSVPDIGGAARGLTVLGERLVQADMRLKQRQSSADRMRQARALNKFGMDLFSEFSAARDFGLQSDIEEFGATMNAESANLIAAHRQQFGEESAVQLEERLGGVLDHYAAQAGVANIKALDAIAAQEAQEVINTYSGRAAETDESVEDLIREAREVFARDQASYRPEQEVVNDANLVRAVYGGRLSKYLRGGQFDQASAFLSRRDVRSAIGEERRQSALNSIARARRDSRIRPLTPEEMLRLGVPQSEIDQGLIITLDEGKGSMSLVYRARKGEDRAKREDRVERLVPQIMAQNAQMDEDEAKTHAWNIVDGNYEWEILESGYVRRLNKVTGDVSEVRVDKDPTDQTQAVFPKESLRQIVTRGNTAGFVGWAKSFTSRTLGQLSDEFVFQQAADDRQTVVGTLNELVRAMSVNPRFPVGEIKRLIEQINIQPQILDSPGDLLSRMDAISRHMRVRLAQEEAAVGNPQLPIETRSSAAQTAKDIRNFILWLDGPDTVPEQGQNVPPAGIPPGSEYQGTLEGFDYWLDPETNTLYQAPGAQ